MKLILTIFLISVQFVLSFCDATFDYCSLNDNVCEGTAHIACGTLETKLDKQIAPIVFNRANITVLKLSDSEKTTLINFLNAQRNKIALGQTRLAKGSNLPKTVWDDELELFAKSLAEIQSIEGDGQYCFRRSNGKIVYSNVLLQKNPTTIRSSIAEILADAENYIDNQVSTEVLKQVGFLSKMGCYFGHVAVKDSDRYQSGLSCVLDFGVERENAGSLYVEGEPCSACKNGVGCDTQFAGLCA